MAIASYDKTKFYNDYDLSAHITKNAGSPPVIAPNSLADLVKRENRFGHDARQFPDDVRGWGGYGPPTLAECTDSNWIAVVVYRFCTDAHCTAGDFSHGRSLGQSDQRQLEQEPSRSALNAAYNIGLRVADDVILTNVIGFDVKVWDPAPNSGGGQGAYVDLGAYPKRHNNGSTRFAGHNRAKQTVSRPTPYLSPAARTDKPSLSSTCRQAVSTMDVRAG